MIVPREQVARNFVLHHLDQRARHEPAFGAGRPLARGDAAGQFRRPIVTEIVPAKTFWRAEEYHQKYLEKRGLTHCHI